MIKRIIAIFLVALTFAFSVPIGAYAAETESEFAWKDLDATPIQEDLKGVDLTKYIKNTSIINPSIIAVAEQGFSEQTDYNNCALYIYVYNPTGKAVKARGLNKLQVKHENTDVKIHLSYVDSTDTIIKFRVDLLKSFFEKLNTKMRIYEISSLELQYVDGSIKDYKIGGTYIFTDNLKLLPTLLSEITAGAGLARTGVSAATFILMLLPSLIFFIIAQSNVLETMASAGIKE